jgi:predicted AlkP superfamily pyrophosphatase or phosphodiesterase
MTMTAKEFQDLITPQLEEKLVGLEVVSEWRAFENMPYQYSPRVDIAIGPFSVAPGRNRTGEYNQLLRNDNIENFLRRIYAFHIENIGDEWLNEIQIPEFDFLIQKNQNARCFCAIEIENTSTKKHIMGSMINAASLGRIGIGIAYNESVKRTFVRILNYLGFLKRVEKNTYDATNFLIVTKEQIESLLDEE